MTLKDRSVREIQRWWTIGRQLYTNRLAESFRDTSASSFPIAELQSVLDEYDDSVIFVHVGLSDVNSAFGERSYDQLCSALTSQFESVLAPGFTPSFRKSGVYHKEYSRPQVGMFPLLFMGDSEYRTNDPIHSIQVAGEYRFDECDHRNTFDPDGCYAQLDDDNVLIANIGTNKLVSTQFHYVSLQADPPYHTTDTHSGEIYYDETAHQEITQTNDAFEPTHVWNRWKMERYLEEQGVLDDRSRNGLKLTFMRARDMREALEPKIERDPYYMVT